MMLRFHDDFYKFSCDPPYLSHRPFLRLLPSFPIARFFFVKASFTFRSPRLQRSRFVVRVPRGLSSAPLDVNFSLARNLLFIRQPRIIPLVAFLLRFLLGSFAIHFLHRVPRPFFYSSNPPFCRSPTPFSALVSSTVQTNSSFFSKLSRANCASKFPILCLQTKARVFSPYLSHPPIFYLLLPRLPFLSP